MANVVSPFVSFCLYVSQCGFFKRAVYYRIMPKYKGVKIRQEERYKFKALQAQEVHKKLWVTSWTETPTYYY